MSKITRKDYMERRATFAEYYRAINATAGLTLAHSDLLPSVRLALENGDEHLNTIPLKVWDMRALSAESRLARAFKEHGDFFSLAGGVCCLKQAAIDAVKGD